MNTYQESFHQQWGDLTDPHVRALAWLLSSPQLLAPTLDLNIHQIATIHLPAEDELRHWLRILDKQPEPLHTALQLLRYRRLGHYAENLLKFYFAEREVLLAHGLQVRSKEFGTVGEFDFLIKDNADILHVELACKFYLFYPHRKNADQQSAPNLFNFFGPNLADSLGAKMNKIVHHQLQLSSHPAAQQQLPESVQRAQVLMKGWLFYREQDASDSVIEGISQQHCRGSWWCLEELPDLAFEKAIILPKLQWLAPARTSVEAGLDKDSLLATLSSTTNPNFSPFMLALMKRDGDALIETQRGMVVPNDWMTKAAAL